MIFLQTIRLKCEDRQSLFLENLRRSSLKRFMPINEHVRRLNKPKLLEFLRIQPLFLFINTILSRIKVFFFDDAVSENVTMYNFGE